VVVLLGAGSLHCGGESDDSEDHPPPAPGTGRENTPVPERPVGTPPGAGLPEPGPDRGGTGGTRANDPFGAGDSGGTNSAERGGSFSTGGAALGAGGGPLPFAGTPSFVNGGRAPFPNTGSF
jgi:hypothetical protein